MADTIKTRIPARIRRTGLLGGDDPTGVAVGYWIATGLTALAAIVEVVFGVDAEQQSLEDIAPPLSEEDA